MLVLNAILHIFQGSVGAGGLGASLFGSGLSGAGPLGSKNLIFIVGKLCLLSAVLLAHGIGDTLRIAHKFSISSSISEPTTDTTVNALSTSLQAFAIIKQRNIFGVKAITKTTSRSTPKPVTPLKLRLVGTQIPSVGRPFAIVEDTKKKKQDVFELNEMIFDQAKLIAVDKESIQIERNGKVEMLLMEDGVRTRSTGVSSNSGQTEFTIAEADLSEALSNLPRLLSQARAVPYFRDGKSIGMRLFAIRRGSLYEKLGLKNGDIILSVNDNSLSDPTQALKLFEELKSKRSINLQLERSGKTSALHYSIR